MTALAPKSRSHEAAVRLGREATFADLHVFTPHLSGPARLRIYEQLPEEVRAAMAANLWRELERERGVRS